MKITEQAIRDAMKLSEGIAITLGTLDEPTRTRIAIVARSVYTVRQTGYTVEMLLQFAAHDKGVLGYPSMVKFDLADTDKLKAMTEAVSEFVTQLQAEGDHDGAAKIAAILTLPCEDIETVHDALVAGLSKSQFIAQLEDRAVTGKSYRNFVHGRDGGLGVFARNVNGVIEWDMCAPSREQDVMSGEINEENRAIYEEIKANAPKSVTGVTSTNSVNAPDIRSKRYSTEDGGKTITSAGGEGGDGPLSQPLPADVEPASTRVRLGNPAAAHLYNVGVNIGGGITYIEVDAKDRAQARRIVEKAGYEVRDVNMIG